MRKYFLIGVVTSAMTIKFDHVRECLQNFISVCQGIIFGHQKRAFFRIVKILTSQAQLYWRFLYRHVKVTIFQLCLMQALFFAMTRPSTVRLTPQFVVSLWIQLQYVINHVKNSIRCR